MNDKSIRVLLAILLAMSLTGYFVGLRQSRQASQQTPAGPQETTPGDETRDVPFAVAYARQPARQIGPNKDWCSNLMSLRQPAAAAPPREPASAQAITLLLQARESGRAFDGAPPIIPHPTPPLGVAACLACHAQGTMIGAKRAAKMSHPLYANCTQCHVEVTSPDSKAFWENTFAALRPTAAERAFAGAPPAMPHPAWMRNDCQGCHGSAGPAPLRTTHPERQNCLQCHALTDAQDFLPRSVSVPAAPTQEKR